jgi:hypothetical protein
MNMRAIPTRGRNVILTHGVAELEAKHFGVESDGLCCVFAAICGVVQFLAEHVYLLSS